MAVAIGQISARTWEISLKEPGSLAAVVDVDVAYDAVYFLDTLAVADPNEWVVDVNSPLAVNQLLANRLLLSEPRGLSFNSSEIPGDWSINTFTPTDTGCLADDCAERFSLAPDGSGSTANEIVSWSIDSMGRLVIDYPSHPDSIIVQKFAEHRDGVYTVLAKIRLDDAPHVVFGDAYRRVPIDITELLESQDLIDRAWLCRERLPRRALLGMKMEEQ